MNRIAIGFLFVLAITVDASTHREVKASSAFTPFTAVVPNVAGEGDTRNAWPFNLPGGGGPGPGSMRYQQVYNASAFPSGGIIGKISFRRDASAAPFTNASLDVRIDLAYSPKSAHNLSDVFAENIGTGRVTVYDGILSLSSPGSGIGRPFDIVIDVENLFHFDPTAGSLLLDVYARNSVATALFDATSAGQQSVSNRVYSADFVEPGGINATRGLIGSNPPLALVTQFSFVPEPGSHLLMSGFLPTLFLIARYRRLR